MRRLHQTMLSFIILLLAVSSAAERRHCNKKELELKNCTLSFKNYKVAVWKDKFSVSDGIRRYLVDMPLVQDHVEWVEVKITPLASNLFVEFIAWQEPDAADIQTKKWYVYQLNRETADLKIDKPLYKRLLIKTGAEGASPKVKADRPKKFGLKLENKSVYWFLDREKGRIE